MNDYAAYIPVVNRPDLLQNAILNAGDVWDDLTIIDNSPNGIKVQPESLRVHRGLVPMTFTQSMNWEFKDCLNRGKKYCIHMHSDSIVPEGTITKLLKAVRQIEKSGRKWGVVYTFYDILACYNPLAAEDMGGFDTTFPAYFSDNDYYYRLKRAGYECIDTGITVGHHGSQTINSDSYLKFVNGVTFPLYRQYYVAKWGGEPGKERFTLPFNLQP